MSVWILFVFSTTCCVKVGRKKQQPIALKAHLMYNSLNIEDKNTETWCVVKCIIHYSSYVVVEAEFQPSAFALPQCPTASSMTCFSFRCHTLSDVLSLYHQGKGGIHYMMKHRILSLFLPKASRLLTNRMKPLNGFSWTFPSHHFLCHHRVLNISCLDYWNVFLTHLPAFCHHFLYSCDSRPTQPGPCHSLP